MYLQIISHRSRSTENVISENRRLNQMVQQNNTSASESTIHNSQNTIFNAKGASEMKQ